jgi:hypothetical protein
MRHDESKLQKACVMWFRLQHRNKLLFAIPNGGKRDKISAKIMQGEGVVPGVADLQLLYGNGEFNSLFIEMKTSIGKQSEKQKEFQTYCEKNKFKYIICRSLEEFIQQVNDYITPKVKPIQPIAILPSVQKCPKS